MQNNNSFDANEIPLLSSMNGIDNQYMSPVPLPNTLSSNDKLTPLPSSSSNKIPDNISQSNSSISVTSSQLPPLPSFRMPINISMNFNNFQPLNYQNPIPMPMSFPIPRTISGPNLKEDEILFSAHPVNTTQTAASTQIPPHLSQQLSSNQDSPGLDRSPLQRTQPINFDIANLAVEMVKCSWCSKKHPARYNKKGKPIKLCLKCSNKKKDYRGKKHSK